MKQVTRESSTCYIGNSIAISKVNCAACSSVPDNTQATLKAPIPVYIDEKEAQSAGWVKTFHPALHSKSFMGNKPAWVCPECTEAWMMIGGKE